VAGPPLARLEPTDIPPESPVDDHGARKSCRPRSFERRPGAKEGTSAVTRSYPARSSTRGQSGSGAAEGTKVHRAIMGAARPGKLLAFRLSLAAPEPFAALVESRARPPHCRGRLIRFRVPGEARHQRRRYRRERDQGDSNERYDLPTTHDGGLTLAHDPSNGLDRARRSLRIGARLTRRGGGSLVAMRALAPAVLLLAACTSARTPPQRSVARTAIGCEGHLPADGGAPAVYPVGAIVDLSTCSRGEAPGEPPACAEVRCECTSWPIDVSPAWHCTHTTLRSVQRCSLPCDEAHVGAIIGDTPTGITAGPRAGNAGPAD
jgi:hypothetical protein